MTSIFFYIMLLSSMFFSSPLYAAASITISLNVSPTLIASTSISCGVDYPVATPTTFMAPVASGTKVATCSVLPTTWTGILSLSGQDAASFAVSGMNIVVGSTALNPLVKATYTFTVTSSP